MKIVLAACLAVLPLAATATELAPQDSHRGGTLRLTADSAFGSIDPALNYAAGFEQVFQVTYDGLVAFRKASGIAGEQIVPDLADSLPPPQDGGRTYVFHLRPNIFFSDGRRLVATDVAQTMRRNFRVTGPGTTFYAAIVGADLCLKNPAGCTLAGGVVADDATRTVTFHLVHPDAEFFDKLALPFADVVPASTPDHDIGNDPTPATGPYMIQHYDPNRHMTLVRNPFFRPWDDQAQPDGYVDRIEYSFGLSDEAEVTAVENNEYDWMYDNKPTDRLGELGARYASRTYVNPFPYIWYVPMNTRLYPFDHLKARQAVEYAIDRYAATIFFGGPGVGIPMCQILPTDFPAHIDYCPYTKGASPAHPTEVWRATDLALARRLVEESGTMGARVTLVVPSHDYTKALGDYIRSVLQQIGYDASVRALDFNIQFTYIQNTNNKVQISLSDWSLDFPAASDFLDELYGCQSFHPGSDSSMNISGDCDRDLDQVMMQAEAVSVTDPKAGEQLWEQADRMISNRAYSVPLMQMRWVDVVSSRLGNYTFSEISRMIFSKVWVQ